MGAVSGPEIQSAYFESTEDDWDAGKLPKSRHQTIRLKIYCATYKIAEISLARSKQAFHFLSLPAKSCLSSL